MAKRRNNSTQRDLINLYSQPIATRSRVLPVARFPSVSYKTNKYALTLIEDRRTHYPGLSPFKRPVVSAAVGRPARIKLIENNRYAAPSQTKMDLAFDEPKKLAICIRRQRRKEVLHAKGVAGSKNLKKPTRNEWSEISCRS